MAFTNKLLDPKNDVAFIGRDAVIEKAYRELDRFYWTEGELLGYEAALKKERDYKAVIDRKFDTSFILSLFSNYTQPTFPRQT